MQERLDGKVVANADARQKRKRSKMEEADDETVGGQQDESRKKTAKVKLKA